MTRALLTLVVGIVLAVLLAAWIAGARGDLSAVLGPILITTAISSVVFGAVVARSRFRRRLEDLEDGVRDVAACVDTEFFRHGQPSTLHTVATA